VIYEDSLAVSQDIGGAQPREPFAEESLSQILEECPDGFLWLDEDYRILFVNRAAEAMLRCDRIRLVGTCLADLAAGGFSSATLRRLAEVARSSCAASFEDLDLTENSHLEITASRTNSGLALFLRDFSARRHLEHLLEEETERRRRVEERFEAALSVNPQVVFTLDRDLTYTWVYNNQIATQDRGAVGKTPADFFDAETVERLLAFFRSVMADNQSKRTEIRLRPIASQQDRYFITSAKPVLAPFGQVIGLTGASIDITEMVRQREELAAAKEEAMRAKVEAERASAAKSKFLAAASHDLRQPVQSLMLLINVLKRRIAESPIDTVVNFMDQALEALHGLLDSLLDISKLDAGLVVPNRDTVSLDALLLRLTSEYRMRSMEKSIDVRFVPASIRTYTDPALLERVLRNLIENAIRYTPSGRILVGCRRKGHSVRIDIVDTGIGIAPENLDSIFEEFYQVDNEARDRTQGLGLGLAIVQRIARLLDVTIEVESLPTRGSRFSVTLPMVSEENTNRKILEAITDGCGQAILVIEDDTILRASFAMMLGIWGLTPNTARSGTDALELVAGGYRPDAIVADYRLTDGMTGIEAISRIRKIVGRTIPGLIVTGDTAPEGETIDVYRILHKPVGAEEFFQVLVDMLKQNPSRQPSRSDTSRSDRRDKRQ
jgi:signal transduction histidine kinase/CheY-like chemotaxis protein